MKTLRLAALAIVLAAAAACDGSITQSSSLVAGPLAADSGYTDPYEGSPNGKP